MQILRAQALHVPALARLRVALLEETGGPLAGPLREEMRALNEAFFQQHLEADAWQDWVAVDGNDVVACGALAFLLRPPYPGNLQGRDAYLLNMYTAPAWRGRGTAMALLDAMLADARERGVRKLILHATEAGRRLYVKLGFKASAAYMELALAGG